MSRTAFYAGSFDPLTLGHLDIIRRGLNVADCVVVGVGVHDAKRPMLDAGTRIRLIETSLADADGVDAAATEIVTFDDLAVAAAERHGATLILRGLRDGTDLDYEAQMAGMNQAMAGSIETVFLVGTPGVRHIAANLVRQIAAMGGDITAFVPRPVAQHLASLAQSG
ncbi:MAG: pantetheine-phosphate adenylyltransferase [Pseudomonadota bacterium]